MCQLYFNFKLNALNSMNFTEKVSKYQRIKQFYATNDHLREVGCWMAIFWTVQSFVTCPKYCQVSLKINCDTQCDRNGLEILPNIQGTFPHSNDAILKSLRALEAAEHASTWCNCGQRFLAIVQSISQCKVRCNDCTVHCLQLPVIISWKNGTLFFLLMWPCENAFTITCERLFNCTSLERGLKHVVLLGYSMHCLIKAFPTV